MQRSRKYDLKEGKSLFNKKQVQKLWTGRQES